MNNIPKTTKFTLKRIVESLNEIPDNGFGEKAKALTPEQKQQLMEMASRFESFGECLKNEEALMSTAKSITEFVELAESYALNECGDVFQKNIVDKDMKEVKKRVVEFQKITKEAYARMQQLGVAYQDIGHILGRYYDLNQAKSLDQTNTDANTGQQTLQMEDNDLELARQDYKDPHASDKRVGKNFDKMEKDPKYRPAPFDKNNPKTSHPSGMTSYERSKLGSHGISSID